MLPVNMHACKLHAVRNCIFRVHHYTHPSSLAILTTFKSSILAVSAFRIWSWQHIKLAGLKTCSTIAVKVVCDNWSPSSVFAINAGHRALSTQSWYISQPIAQEERCDSVQRATNSAFGKGCSSRGGQSCQYSLPLPMKASALLFPLLLTSAIPLSVTVWDRTPAAWVDPHTKDLDALKQKYNHYIMTVL